MVAVLPGSLSGSGAGVFAAPDLPLAESLDEYERRLIVRALDGAKWNVADAARRLRTDRPNLYRRMKRLGIDDPRV